MASAVQPKRVRELLPYLTPKERSDLDALIRSLPPDYERYRKDPIAWMVERMGIPEHTLRWSLNPGYATHDWDGTVDPIVAIAMALAEWHSVGVEAAIGTQKTYNAALLGMWFLDCFVDSTVVTSAPGSKQLEKHLWKEVGKLWSRFKKIRPEAELTHLRIRMRPGMDLWSMYAVAPGIGASEDSATRAQGEHAEHMLFIVEETPGMDDAVLTAFDNTCVSPHNLQLRQGNPDNQLDPLHRFCERPSVVSIRISSRDHPNVVCDNASVVPGAASRHGNEIRREDYGPDSPLTQSRERGISPMEAFDALIKWEWLMKAVEIVDPATAEGRAKAKELRAKGPRAMGHDVANSIAGDRASVAEGEGALLEQVWSKACPDAGAFFRLQVAPKIGPNGFPANRVGVDTVGVGASAFNEATRLKLFVVSLVGGASPMPDPSKEEEFYDLRSQMYWTFMLELFHLEFGIAKKDQELFTDLVTPKWGTKNGMIFVESKETLKKRLPGQRSPDKGDAAVYWNWVRKDRRPHRFKMPSVSQYTG